MTVQEHMLCAEAQLLLAEERLAVESVNAQRARKLSLAKKYLEEAIVAGQKEDYFPKDED